jgi:hypothetical protein
MKRKRLFGKAAIVIGTALSFLSPGYLSATTIIDTAGIVDGGVGGFGPPSVLPNTATWGQTFVAPESLLTSFSLYLNNDVVVGAVHWIYAGMLLGGMVFRQRLFFLPVPLKQ